VKLTSAGELILPAERHNAALAFVPMKLKLPKRELSQLRDQRVLKSGLNELWLIPETFHQAEISHKKAQKAQKHEEILCAFVAKCFAY